MSAGPQSHPDRLAETLANLAAARAERPNHPGRGPTETADESRSADCRIDLKLLAWQALQAAGESPAAAEHLARYSIEQYPELWAGTVRDGVARGFAAHLEEVVSLAPAAVAAPEPTFEQVLEARELRRKKDLLVASGGARVRFSRKQGLLFVDREHEVHSENCIWFEAREDVGTLDGFAGHDDQRPRLFSAQFLRPIRYATGKQQTELTLQGRLGRGAIGWPCRIHVHADRAAPTLRLTIELERVVRGWRLRTRILGVPESLVQHHCLPVREVVANHRGGFVADTLVRSCGNLLVDGKAIDVPAAADPGAVRHLFTLGCA